MRALMLNGRLPGVNVDVVDVDAGIREAAAILGGLTQQQVMVLGYALNRWRRGEEGAAMRNLCEVVDLTGAYRIIAAGLAGSRAT